MPSVLIRQLSTINILALISVGALQFFLFIPQVSAANFQQLYVRLDRLHASVATTGLICANPGTTSAANVDVQITFPTGFTVGTAGNWAVSTGTLPPGATAWPGIGAATPTVLTQTVTFTYAANQTLTAGTLYCFTWTNTAALTTGTAGNDKTGTITSRTSGLTTIDSTSYALSLVSNDQIVITATVPATFSFALSGNSDTFTGNLSTTTVSTSGQTVSISTNAQDGWIAWVKSLNAGLNSAGTGASIASAGSYDDAPTDLASTTGYVLDVDITTDSGTGTGTVSQSAGTGAAGDGYGAEYNGTNATSGGTLTTSFQPIAASDGTTGGDVLTLIERAKISAVQAAATDYTDTLTIVAAGRF